MDRDERRGRTCQREPLTSASACGVRAALEIIREEGFERLGVNALVERSGLRKALIYRYFEDLPALLRPPVDELDPFQPKAAAQLMADMPRDALFVVADPIVRGLVPVRGMNPMALNVIFCARLPILPAAFPVIAVHRVRLAEL
ncbi:MAG: helix-turn-helix domain-containing protein [Spirochaetota bacterium]